MILNCWIRLLRVPWTARRSKQVNPKGNQSWICIGRTDAEAETPILWPPDVKNWLIGKYPDAGKDWRQEKGMTEGEIIGWHHRLNGHEFEQASGIGTPGVLQSIGSQTVRLHWATELNTYIYIYIHTHIYIYTHMCIYIQVCMLWLKISKHWFNRVSLNNATFLKTLVALGKYHCLHIPIFWWNEKRMNIFILYRVVNVLYKVSCKLRNIIIQ